MENQDFVTVRRKRESQRCIVVLGMEEQGLALVRCMHKTHKHVHFFVDQRRPKHAWEATRCGVRHSFSNLDELEQELQDLQTRFPDKLCLFISSANLLTDIRLNRPSLYESYQVSSSPLHWIDTLTTKHLMYEYISRCGAKTTPYCLLKDYHEGMLRFPLILKRDIEFVLSFKTKRVNTQEEMGAFVKGMPDNPEYIIVQEMVSPEARDLSLHAYVHKGAILGSVAFEEVRHYPTGISSYMEEMPADVSQSLHSEAEKLLGRTDYCGFAQIDFKYLPDGTAIIMDINTRTPGSHSAFHCKFSNWKNFYAGLPDNPVKLIPRKKRVRWINFVRDFVGTKAKGKMSQTFKDMFGAHWDVFDWNDPRPFFKTFFLILEQSKCKNP